jgi:ferric-dicitrate binding protein FerR (iron transport regulator)
VTDRRNDWRRIARHLEACRVGSVSPEQEADFQEWLRRDSALREKWAATKALWSDGPKADDSSEDPPPDLDAAWSDIVARLDLP